MFAVEHPIQTPAAQNARAWPVAEQEALSSKHHGGDLKSANLAARFNFLTAVGIGRPDVIRRGTYACSGSWSRWLAGGL